jgi:transcriptional regulator with XRE-family HTH domain
VTEEHKTLGEAIREVRLAKGLTLRQLAKKLGVSAPFLSDVEHDRRRPARDRFPKLAKILGVDLEYLTQSDPRTLEERVANLEHRVKMLERGPWRAV